MCDEDLHSSDNLSERNRPIILPLLDGLGVFNKDEEIVGVSLVEDLLDFNVSADHFA